MDGTEPDRIMHILNMALVEILSQKLWCLKLLQYQKSLLLFQMPEPSSIPEENVIAEEHINCKTVIVGDTEK
jgi:hypothetical protein